MNTAKPNIPALRAEARAKKRTSDISYSAALDEIAEREGFSHWNHFIAHHGTAHNAAERHRESARRRPCSDVMPLPVPKRWTYTYHRVQIEGEVFNASLYPDHIVSSDLYIARELHGQSMEAVQIGMEHTISDLTQRPSTFGDERCGWWVTKYGDQPRIDINRLTAGGRNALAREFGLRFFDQLYPPYLFDLDFRECPAFMSLCSWAQAFPRRFARSSGLSVYIGDWGSWVRDELARRASSERA